MSSARPATIQHSPAINGEHMVEKRLQVREGEVGEAIVNSPRQTILAELVTVFGQQTISKRVFGD